MTLLNVPSPSSGHRLPLPVSPATPQVKPIHSTLSNIPTAASLYSTRRKTPKSSTSLHAVRHPLDKIPQRKLPPYYASLIASHCRSQQWEAVLSTFALMVSDGARPDKFLLPKILKACSELRNLITGAAVHGYILRISIELDVFVGNSLIDMYAKCSDLDSARAVFDRMAEKDVVSWTALLNSYSDAGLLDEAVGVFRSMKDHGTSPDLISWNALISGFARNGEIGESFRLLEEMRAGGLNPGINSWNGIISGCVQNGFFEDAFDVFCRMCSKEKPNAVTIASFLPACSGLRNLSCGKELHCYMIRREIRMNIYVGGSLIDMYLKCGRKEYAERVFAELENKNPTIWNEMIAAYAGEDKISEALELLKLMKEEGLKPDVVTYNTILAGYARKGQKNEVFELFSEMDRVGIKPNVISMNALISGFHHSGLNSEALELFRAMQLSNETATSNFKLPINLKSVSVQPNAVSITSALSVCTDLKLHHLGKEIHAYIIRNHFDSNVFVSSALVDMYADCKDMNSARRTFYGITDKNVVSWNVLMAGYNQSGDPQTVLRLFPEMLQQSDVIPNSITLMILLLACSNTTALRLGRELHGYIEKQRPDDGCLILAGGLIGMYTKCCSIKDARLVFDYTDQKDIALWNAMISGYSLHGMAKDALSLFKEMEKSGIKPDHITFIAVLSACNQEGLVDEGWKYFNMMEDAYNVAPTLEHFTCMVNIMASAGLLEESLDFVRRMPFQPDACMWATLLKACKLHSNYEVGEKAARALFELEPSNASNYIVLSNIFASSGMWDFSMDIVNDMKARGLKMAKTCSWIYIGNTIHSFEAGDRSHPEMEKILDVWNDLARKMEQRGYVPQKVLFCDSDGVGQFSCFHTEKLAVCFGLISLQAGSPILVSKNVRMCMDCHSSVKFISKIVEREIFVIDGCFYHHFRDGVCTCRDNW